jgi:hypothetical protein
VPIYKKGDKTNCCNYHIIALVNYNQNFIQCPAVRVNFILEEITGDHQCGC